MITKNSRADALTYRLTEFDVLLDEYLEALQDGPRKEQVDARNELRLAYRTALLASSANETAAEPTACKGKNCGSLDPRFHSAECFEEYEKTVGLKPAMAAEAVAIPNSPAYCLRGLYKPADEYFIDGKPCTPDEYIAWQAGIIEAVTKAKLPDPKYYGGSAEEGDQHDVKCAYVDGWNDCRASILAAPQPAQADARVRLTGQSAKLYNGRTAAQLKEICSTRPAHYPEAHHEFDKTILALIDEIERLQARAASASRTDAVIEALKQAGLFLTNYEPETICTVVQSLLKRAASANETGAEGAKRGTPEQIQAERKLTCEAIDGAMAFGYQNTNPPPSADHWLAPYWHIGRKQAELESRARAMAEDAAPPSGYAYRYSHHGGAVIRFNNGGEVNGSRPIEAVPYWFAAPPPAQADARVGHKSEGE